MSFINIKNVRNVRNVRIDSKSGGRCYYCRWTMSARTSATFWTQINPKADISDEADVFLLDRGIERLTKQYGVTLDSAISP